MITEQRIIISSIELEQEILSKTISNCYEVGSDLKKDYEIDVIQINLVENNRDSVDNFVTIV